MFSPNLGRWLTVDPKEYEAGTNNLYEASGNNPVNNLDPFGLQLIPSPGTFGRGLMGGGTPPLRLEPLQPYAKDPRKPISEGTCEVTNSQSPEKATGMWTKAGGIIEFVPKSEKAKACKTIKMVQTVKKVLRGSVERGNDRNKINAAVQSIETDDGWHVDIGLIQLSNCVPGRPCSPYYHDHVGGTAGGNGKAAWIQDTPHDGVFEKEWYYETCARCVETGEWLGCATWGFKAVEKPLNSGIMSYEFMKPVYYDRPSKEFSAAVSKFSSVFPNE